MPTNRNVIDFKIHNLTEEQFQELKDAGQIDPNALYCTPDETVMKFEELGERIDTANERIDTKQDIATAINYSHVTNCITEIPQDIKLELADGALILKAGSKVYVPNGSGNYTEITIENDLSRIVDSGFEGILVYYPEENRLSSIDINYCSSGTVLPSAPIGTNNWVYYKTDENKIYYTEDAGETWSRTYSFPLCIFTSEGTTITRINQVFNGFGYIGSTVFALPGVKGLIPDGRNADGSLKNIEVAVSSVQIFTAIGYGYGLAYGLYSNGEISARNNACYAEGSKPTWFDGGLYGTWFETESNKMLYTEDAGASWTQIHIVSFGSAYVTNAGQLDYLKTKTAFRAVDYNDLTDTLKNTITIAAPAGIVSAFAGTSAPSGWLKCDGSAISRTLYADLFAAIGTKYGSGDGSTTFNLPTQSVLPLGTSAPVYNNGAQRAGLLRDATTGQVISDLTDQQTVQTTNMGSTGYAETGVGYIDSRGGLQTRWTSYDPNGTLAVNLSQATGAQAIACIKY